MFEKLYKFFALIFISVLLNSCYLSDEEKKTSVDADCADVSHSFSTNVLPIFSQCTGSGCHSTVTPVLSTNAFQNMTDAGVIDKDVPSDSKILRKPLGLDSHSGGTIFTDVNDEDYKTIFCWIKVDSAENN